MPRRTGKEGLYQRVVESNVKDRKESINKKEAKSEVKKSGPRKKKVSAILSKFEDFEPEIEFDCEEDCIDDLPSDIRRAVIKGSWGGD